MINSSRNKKPVSHWKEEIAEFKRNIHPDKWYIDPNKQKIRGWKRRVTDVHNWGAAITVPSLAYWDVRRSGYDSNRMGTYPYIRERYTVYPWYSFYKHRQPPLCFFKEIIKQFVKAFDSWDKIFKERNEPYDLFIEIFDPHYILSTLHCVKMEKEGDRYNYWPLSEVNKPFPIQKFGSKAYDLFMFDWELHVEKDYIADSELEYRETDEPTLLNRGYEKDIYPDYTLFSKPIGDVWIGRKKANT